MDLDWIWTWAWQLIIWNIQYSKGSSFFAITWKVAKLCLIVDVAKKDCDWSTHGIDISRLSTWVGKWPNVCTLSGFSRTRYLLKVKLFFLSILKCTLKSEAFLFFPTFNYAFELISIWIVHALCDWHVVTVASVTSSQDTKCHLPKFCSQHKTNGQTDQ